MGEETDDVAYGLSKYRDEIKALTGGVDIMVDDEHYKDMYDIFVELASVWDTIESDTNRSRIAEILGGTRNLSGISSTIQNIADAINAYDDAMNASKVSEEANALYMDTARAHAEQLKATFQELSADLVNTDLIKSAIDALKTVLELIDSIIKKFGGFTALPIAGLVATIMEIRDLGGFKSFGDFTTAIGLMAENAVAAVSSIGLLQAALTSLGAVIVGIGIYALVSYIDNVKHAVENARKEMMDASSEYNDAKDRTEALKQELDETRQAYENLETASHIEYVDETELEKLREATELLQLQYDIAKREEESKAIEAADAAVDAYRTEFKTPASEDKYREYYTGNRDFGTIALPSLTADHGDISAMIAAVDVFRDLRDEQEEGSDEWLEYGEAARETEDIIWNQVSTLLEYKKAIESIPEELRTDRQKSALDEIAASIDYIQSKLGSPLDDVISGTSATYDKAMEKLRGYVDEMVGANVEEGNKRYKEALDDLANYGVDASKTVFGNIDLGNRQVLTWTEDMLSKYKDELESWGQSVEELKGGISTVLGSSSDFGGLEIAFSPILQTEDGPVLLGKETVNTYIRNLIAELSKDGEEWTSEDLLKLDAKGTTVNGRKIKNIIADIGDTAKDTGEVMHYLGEDGEIADALKQIDDANKLAAMSAEDFVNAYGSNSTINDIVEEAIALGIAADDSESELSELATKLFDVGIIGSDTAGELGNTVLTLEELSGKIKEFSEFQDKLTSAMDASKSAVGLNTEQINDLKDAYKDLEDFDAAKLFETTYNGVHLNEEELKRLNEEAANNKLAELYTTLASKLEKYHKVQAEGGDTSKIVDEIYDTELLISQYEGLTSAYNTYLSAKSGKKERDSYEGIGADYEEMKKILDMGWYGDDSLNSYLDLILSKAARTGDAVKDFERLNKTIEGTSHSILDYWQYDENSKELASDGLFSFLKDVNKKFGDTYASVEDGNYVFDLTGNKLNEVADAFGMSAEMIQIFERALIDTGSVVVLDNDKIEEITGSLKDLQNAGEISPDIDLNFDLAEMSLEDIQSKIKELNEAKAKINVETDEDGTRKLQLLDAAVSALQNKAVSLKINTAIENGATVEELMNMDDETLKSTLNIEVNGDTELQQARDMLQTLSSGTSVPITVKIDESQFSALTNSGSEATIVYHVNRTEVDAFIEESHDDDATVTYGVDRSLVDAFRQSNINRTATVTYTADTSKLPTTFTRLKRYIDYVHVGEASGTMRSVKTARANGSMYNAPLNYKRAFANGSVALDEDELALVNELGTESIILFVTLYSDVYRTIYLIAGNSLEPNMLQHNYEI